MARKKALHARESLLRATFARVKVEAPKLPLVVQSDLAKYLCVLTSGFLERAVSESLMEYAKTRGTPQLGTFVTSKVGRLRNLKTSTLLGVVRSFDKGWGDRLEKYVAGSRGLALDSVVNNKNLIAHGDVSGVGLAQVEGWFESTIEVVKELRSILGVQ